MARSIRIRFETMKYECSHGKLPRGRGQWVFRIVGQPGLWWSEGCVTYSEAKKQVRKKAQTLGLDGLVFVEVCP